MNFALTEEQEMLRKQARSFMETKFPPERIAELSDASGSRDRASWRQIAELGWTGLSVPETLGGAGGSFVDEAVVIEEQGRVLYPGPYFSTAIMSLPAIEHTADLLGRAINGELTLTLAWAEPSGPFFMTEVEDCGTKAERYNGSWRLTGEKFLVPDLSVADRVIVAASTTEGVGLFATEQTGESSLSLDPTRSLGGLRLEATRASLLVEPRRATEVIQRIRLRALAALAVEAVGVSQKALELATDYSKLRRQFDKPIGSFQAVSHQVADIYVETELARSLAYWAAWCVAEEDESAQAAAASAKAFCAETAVRACERSIQVHGGVGFTWEHMLHRYYRRAQWIDAFEGHGRIHREQVARELLDSVNAPAE
jgi:alkylation response protein AidB-like acyl-CoA dehydrogenase